MGVGFNGKNGPVMEPFGNWVSIPGFRNLAREDGCILGIQGSILVPKWNKAIQYWWVKAASIDRNLHRTWCIHHLICLAFNGKRPPGMEACHLNGNRDDNSSINLIWGTHKLNGEHMILHGNNNGGRPIGMRHGR